MSILNGSDSLTDSIESVLSQTYRYFELIIIDDASTDDTGQKLFEYQRRDARIRILKNKKNIGLTPSLNKGLAVARGQLIARIDAGDRWESSKLERQVLLFEKNPNFVLIGTQVIYFTKGDGTKNSKSSFPISDYTLRKAILKGRNPFVHSSMVFKKLLFYTVREYESCVEDYELWLRYTFHGAIAIIDEYLTFYEKSPSSISYCYRDIQVSNALRVYQWFTDYLLANDSSLKKTSAPQPLVRLTPKEARSHLFAKLYTYAWRKKSNREARTIVFIAYLTNPKLLSTKLRQAVQTTLRWWMLKKHPWIVPYE